MHLITGVYIYTERERGRDDTHIYIHAYVQRDI